MNRVVVVLVVSLCVSRTHTIIFCLCAKGISQIAHHPHTVVCRSEEALKTMVQYSRQQLGTICVRASQNSPSTLQNRVIPNSESYCMVPSEEFEVLMYRISTRRVLWVSPLPLVGPSFAPTSSGTPVYCTFMCVYFYREDC
jgi:hypothetical protein